MAYKHITYPLFKYVLSPYIVEHIFNKIDLICYKIDILAWVKNE